MSVVRGLPQELVMQSVALPEGVTSQSVKVVPQNLSSITSNTTSVVAADGVGAIKEITVPSTQVIFDIPTVASKNTWIDTAKSTISFRVRYQHTAGGTAFDANALQARLRSSAWSFFNRIFHTSSTGEIVDDCPLTNLAHHQYMSFNNDAAELDSVALSYGFDYQDGSSNSINGNTGHAINSYQISPGASATFSSYYSYEFPLPSSLIGKYCKGMFPIGKVNKLQITLQTDTTAPITTRVAVATASASASLSFVMDNIALNLQYVDLGEEGGKLLGSADSAVVHGITHRVSQSTLPAGKGAVSILMGLRGSSVRSIATRVVDGSVSASGSSNGIYDSKMLHANSMNYFLGGKDRVPPNPINVIAQPASAFMRALHASEAFNDRQLKYNSTPQEYLKYCATSDTVDASGNQYDQRIITAGSGTLPTWLANWCFAMPLQKVSKSKILDGYNFNSSNQFFEANIVATNSASASLYFVCELDVIFVIQDGVIMTRI